MRETEVVKDTDLLNQNLDLSDLIDGWYFIQVVSGEYTKETRLIIKQ